MNVNKGMALSPENVLINENEDLLGDDVSSSDSDEAEESDCMPSTSGAEKREVRKFSDDMVTTKNQYCLKTLWHSEKLGRKEKNKQ